ncbi:hypothetical protein HNQ95_006076 [Aminobacter ciceronei]|uniref:Uncharacterized protein n=1 Tax=Aminobacter ciceronei TaxID=150723 RepID=A0ABR6CG32_9HYPH|nr:hypothetical protein [Aminobacter ciceronei]MBA9023999.1 hypothetical protein [Aminobacter ciceronei]
MLVLALGCRLGFAADTTPLAHAQVQSAVLMNGNSLVHKTDHAERQFCWCAQAHCSWAGTPVEKAPLMWLATVWLPISKTEQTFRSLTRPRLERPPQRKLFPPTSIPPRTDLVVRLQ